MTHPRFVRGAAAALIAVLLLAFMPMLKASALGAVEAELTSALDLVAGQAHALTFRVNNPPNKDLLGNEQNTSVNYVQIRPGPYFTVGTTTTAPAGWTFSKNRFGYAVFRGTLPPGQSVNFTVQSDASRPGVDTPSKWVVQASDNGGQTLAEATVPTLKTTTVNLRVLQVDTAAITAPPGAVDNSVTQQQDNVKVAVTVRNAGSQILRTTPTLTSGGGDTTVLQPLTTGGPTYQDINPNGGTATFTFNVTFAGPGTRALTADATAPKADGVTPAADAIGASTVPLTVQSKAVFTSVKDTLSPLASKSGITRDFTTKIAKTGAVGIASFSTSNSRLTFSGPTAFSATLKSPTALAAGPVEATYSFGSVTIPGPDGDYAVSFSLTGTDTNGALVPSPAGDEARGILNQQFTIDDLVPDVVPILEAPNRIGQVGSTRLASNGDSSKPFVAKDGDTLNFKGDIYATGTSGALDSRASIITCYVKVFDSAGGVVKVENVTCANDAGKVSGSTALSFGTLSGSAVLGVQVRDPAGNTSGVKESAAIKVDNVLPTFTEARTGCETAVCATELKTIRVISPEPIIGDFVISDFTVAENVVVDVGFTPGVYLTVVTLTLAEDLGENDKPAVEYNFTPLPNRSRQIDAPGNLLPTYINPPTRDGIAPSLPSILTVDGRAVYDDDGRFYTNNATPSVTLGGLDEGYRALVARETNGVAGFQYGSVGDKILCEADVVAAGVTTATCTSADLGTDGLKNELYGASLDASHNLSVAKDGTDVGEHGAEFKIMLDRVAPRVSAGTVNKGATNNVVVAFDDQLDHRAGRNFAIDWEISGIFNGDAVSFSVASVAPDATNRHRVVSIDGQDSQWPTARVDNVRYILDSTDDDRLRDRAGNLLADFSLTLGG